MEKRRNKTNNEMSLNELLAKKCYNSSEYHSKIEDLEKNLELANINKRRNSLDLESAVLIHENSPNKLGN